MDVRQVKCFLYGVFVSTFCSICTFSIFVLNYNHIENHLSNDELIVHANHKVEVVQAQELYEKVKVLCWVLTCPKNHDKKAKHVKATWGRRCNKLIFMSSLHDPTLPSIDLNVTEGHAFLWGKTKAAFSHVYDNYLNEYDWFLKADDDAYVILENLRYMLSIYNSSFPIYFGRKINRFTKQGFMSGGAGYVLSNAALKAFIEQGLPDSHKCTESNKANEDVELGKCLEHIGVLAGDSRDELGNGRFFPLTPTDHISQKKSSRVAWFLTTSYYQSRKGLSCCSDTAISFHYISPQQLYELEYLIYHVRPFGINQSIQYPAALPPDNKSIPDDLLRKRMTTSEQIITENKYS